MEEDEFSYLFIFRIYCFTILLYYWMFVVTSADHPKSVRSLRVIAVLVAFSCCQLIFEFSVGMSFFFCHRTELDPFFLLQVYMYMIKCFNYSACNFLYFDFIISVHMIVSKLREDSIFKSQVKYKYMLLDKAKLLSKQNKSFKIRII